MQTNRKVERSNRTKFKRDMDYESRPPAGARPKPYRWDEDDNPDLMDYEYLKDEYNEY